MKLLPFFIATLALAASPAAIALTVERDITPEYVRSHADELSVKVAKDKNGLIAFTVVFTLPQPRYVIAHLVVRSGDRMLAKSDTPAFTKRAQNTFYFSVLPECLATSEFTLGVSHFGDADGVAAELIPGSTNYRFRLPDFVSAELSKAPDDK